MRLERLAFFGTPEFAVPTLRALVAAERPPVVVVSQPSRAIGRGQRVRPPAVARAAEELGLELWQPRSIRKPEFLDRIAALDLELAVVVAYGKIFPVRLLAMPRLGCINLHASLLPKYRGAAPIQAAIANGDTSTGCTTMLMEEGLDSGPILEQERLEIGPQETAAELAPRLADLGAQLLVDTVLMLEYGYFEPRPQDESQVSLAPMLRREDGIVDWSLEAVVIANRLRAYTPWPGQTAMLRGEPVKLVEARTLEAAAAAETDSEPGTLLGLVGEELGVVCGHGTVLGVSSLQRPGRRALSARDFVNGERLRAGERFDETPEG